MGAVLREPVYIIIPVHNRKVTTLDCLRRLCQNGDLACYHVVVVDDGSTDGTADAIQALYPDVTILKGDGNLWWTGAIALGMQHAYAQGAEFLMWLNDDTLPTVGAIQQLLQACRDDPKKIASAQCYAAADLQTMTYSGKRKTGIRHTLVPCAIDQTIQCDTLPGNLVCIPRSVVDHIGLPPPARVPHYHGDSVYTWRAKQAGYTLEVLGSAIALCAQNPGDPSWLLSNIPITHRWQSFLSPKSTYYIPGYWQFCLEVWGLIGILVFVQPYLRLAIIWVLRLLLPTPVLKRVKAQFASQT